MMKEEVRKGVLKLLEAGMIYAIVFQTLILSYEVF